MVEVPEYIASDPVAFMHQYHDPMDQNLAGFLAALMAWGRRDIVMAKVNNLLQRFGTNPADFIGNLTPADEKRLDGFRHRTFTSDDIRWILLGLSRILHQFGSFEAFWKMCYQESISGSDMNVTGPSALMTNPIYAEKGYAEKGYAEKGCAEKTTASLNTKRIRPMLSIFQERFLQLIPDAPMRIRKHLASPDKNSSCKRFWLFLRWAIRQNSCVDPGTMLFMPPSNLMVPLDVHVARYSRMFGLLTRPYNDWKAVTELTDRLRFMNQDDPAKYDYALFGLGIRDIVIPEEFILNPEQ